MVWRPAVSGISRGGYGIGRLLPYMPWEAVAGAVARGTKFVGFSDFTAFQLGALAKTNAITWAGPALCESFGRKAEAADSGSADAQAIDEITLACFTEAASGESEGVGWRLPKADRDALKGGADEFVARNAVFWGGNLAMATSLLGTPWFPEIDGGVLFLEDVGEHPYRIERMLSQLLYAGVLEQQAAIVLGQFTAYKLTPHDRGYSFAKAIAWLREHVSVPILTGLPFGHVPTKVMLPVGARVDLLIQDSDALILWGHHDA